MKTQQGFTLIELMIVVAIVAILAGIGIPAYGDYVRRGKIAEAATNLAGLRVSMEQYYQDNRTYLNGAACGVAMPLVGVVVAGAPTVQYFNFACAATANAYTITAAGAGGMAGFSYNIDQTNAKTTVAVPAGWSLPSPNACWVTKQGGVC